MAELIVLVVIAAVIALYVGVPWRVEEPLRDDEQAILDLRVLREDLIFELDEIEQDLAAARISEQDRQEGRQAVGRKLRAVDEALRALGEMP